MLLDARGKEILPGQTIVYPGRQGSSLWLNFATVQDVGRKVGNFLFERVIVAKRQDTGRQVIIEKPERVVVL